MVAGALCFGALACGGDDDARDATATTVERADNSCALDDSCELEPERSSPRDMIGKRAPAVEGANLTGAGTTSLAAYAGKPAAVVFWVNVCPHCIESMPKVEALQTKLGDAVQFFSVAIHDPAAEGAGPQGFETPAAAAASMGLTMPTVVAERAEVDGEWRLRGVPTAFVLDAAHIVVDVVEPDAEHPDIVEPLEDALAAAR